MRTMIDSMRVRRSNRAARPPLVHVPPLCRGASERASEALGGASRPPNLEIAGQAVKTVGAKKVGMLTLYYICPQAVVEISSFVPPLSRRSIAALARDKSGTPGRDKRGTKGRFCPQIGFWGLAV